MEVLGGTDIPVKFIVLYYMLILQSDSHNYRIHPIAISGQRLILKMKHQVGRGSHETKRLYLWWHTASNRKF